LIKGSSLILSLSISLLITLVSSFFILYAQSNRIIYEQYSSRQKSIENVASGIEFLLSNQAILPVNKQTIIDLFDSGSDSVILKKRNWGGFEIISASVIEKNEIFSKSAIVGQLEKHGEKISLYLTNNKEPLSLCGNTILNGLCYLPENGVKMATIEGQNYVGNKLVNGVERTSESELPAINLEMINENYLYLSGIFQNDDSVINEFFSDTIIRSFDKSTLLIKLDRSANLSGIYLSGNIIIYSHDEINISNNSYLENIVIYAKSINILEGFVGSLQLFASQKINISDNVLLPYPSVVALLKDKSDEDISVVNVGENSTIKGSIFSYSKNETDHKSMVISILSKAAIYGEVYSNGYVDLKGKVYGSVHCNQFYLKTPSSVYINHLLNAEIDASKLSKFYIGINMLNKPFTREVVKWIN
jgi:hypothetical protein